jgi:hypothetical protein
MLVAFLAWPLLTAVPAFFVALIAASVLRSWDSALDGSQEISRAMVTTWFFDQLKVYNTQSPWTLLVVFR